LRQKDENKVLCLFNFSDKEQTFKINDAISGNFNPYLGEKISLNKENNYSLKSWGYSVFISQ